MHFRLFRLIDYENLPIIQHYMHTCITVCQNFKNGLGYRWLAYWFIHFAGLHTKHNDREDWDQPSGAVCSLGKDGQRRSSRLSHQASPGGARGVRVWRTSRHAQHSRGIVISVSLSKNVKPSGTCGVFCELLEMPNIQEVLLSVSKCIKPQRHLWCTCLEKS